MAYAKRSLRKEKRDLREQMRSMGLGYRDIAAEFARRYRLRPRAAWREAYEWSLQETADRINDFRGNTGLDPGGFAGMTAPHLSEYENWPGHGPQPSGRRPTPYLLAVLAAVYDCAATDLIDLTDRERLPPAELLILDKYGNRRHRAQPPRPGRGEPTGPSSRDSQNRQDVVLAADPADHAGPDSGGQHGLSLLRPGQGGDQEEQDPVRRRTFIGLTGASMVSALLAEPASRSAHPDTEPFASVLTGTALSATVTEPGPPADTSTLTAEVSEARGRYQACRYSELATQLPGLLERLHAACLTVSGDTQKEALALSADAHHVAAGLLLKLDDQGLASLAADRSMRAAEASEDPVAIAASARIITHTLMSGGHLPAAASAATSHAARLDRDIDCHTPESLSVYGALLLRGSVAAALGGKRGTAHELLDEAGEAAERLGGEADGNLRGTAFGPANAVLHRVNVAVTLGDAGTAIDAARRVNLSKITLTERKATLLIDVARAYLQWGRHEKAYLALRAAESTAREEISGRPLVRRLVRELVTTAPPGIRGEAGQFAEQIGVAL
jgi:hypothetical protein